MVATDVASRGIGMLERIVISFPFLILSLLLTLCGSMWIVVLSTTDSFVPLVFKSGLLMSRLVLF